MSASTGCDAALWLCGSEKGRTMSAAVYRFYVGIDWATEKHRVVVLDAERRVVREREVCHEGAALESFADWLTHLAASAVETVAVALEVPRGAVVDVLLARGFHVFALNPKQLDRFRDRFTVAGAKDDRRDAQVLASALATDLATFRRLEPEHPLLLELRELSRLEDDLQEELGRLTNRLREQLHRYYPQLLHLVPAADEPWLWTLLERAPTPSVAQHLPRATVRTILSRHRIRRVDTDAVLATLRAPALPVAPGTVQAAQRHLAVLLPRLRLIHQQRAECATQIEGLLERLGESQEHRDVPILRSVVGVGRVVAATMLAEASRLLAARDYHGLRRRPAWHPSLVRAGAAPWSACATRAIRGCARRRTIGASPPPAMIRSVARTTNVCAPAGIVMRARYVASWTACSTSSSPC